MRAINCVLAQTFTNFELIVVDDGSTDRGPEIVRSARDQRIRLIGKANGGVASARNFGISEAKSDLLAFLDADDEWFPDFLARAMLLNKEYPDASVFALGYIFADSADIRRNQRINGLIEGFSLGVINDYFEIACQSDPPICSSSVVIKKQAILDVGGFPLGIRVGEDLLTWAKLAAKYQVVFSREPQAVFWQAWNNAASHKRLPPYPDLVAEQLSRLLDQIHPDRRFGLIKYIAHWHTMRASIFLEQGEPKSARKEIRIAGKLAGYSTKRVIYLFLSLLTVNASKSIQRRLMAIRRYLNARNSS